MVAGEELLKLINKDKVPPSDQPALLFATIQTINPVSIRIDGTDNDIPSQLLILSPFVRHHVLPKPHIHYDVPPDTSTTKKETADIDTWRGLRAGDKVAVMKLNAGKIYVIMWRVEMEGFRD